MTSPLDAALAYAAAGLPVFPVARDKSPLTPHGFKDATTDTTTIRDWWTRFPEAGVAIPTGQISGIVVLDIDPRHGGDESFDAMMAEHGRPPFGPEVRTGGGGRHLYYRHPGGGVAVSHGFRPGLDLQADGAYVVAPPSGHPSGGTYSWTVPLIPGPPPTLLPPWLLEEAARHRVPGGGTTRTFDVTTEGTIPEGRHHDWIVAQAASIASRTPGITEPMLLEDMHALASIRLRGCSHHEQEIRLAVRSAVAKFGRSADRSVPGSPSIGTSAGAPAANDGALAPVPEAPVFPEYLFTLNDKGELHPSFPGFVSFFRSTERFVVPIERGTFSSPGQFEILRYESGYYNGKARSFIRGRVTDAFRSRSLEPRDDWREQVVKALANGSEVHRARDTFNPPTLLCLDNGVLDTSNLARGIQPHTPDRVFTWKLPVRYDPSATCPRFEQFLREIMPDSVPDGARQRELIVDLLGYCLWRENPFQVFFMLVGDGANGKTTLGNVIRSLLGKDAIAELSLQQVSAHRFMPADLDGRLVNICDDLPFDHPIKDTGPIKVLTGNGTLTVERKGQHPFQLRFGGKFISMANRTPPVHDDTYAFWRRVMGFRFDQTFPAGDPRRDPELGPKLLSELPGILNLALSGLARVRTRLEFDPDHVLVDFEEEWRRRADPVRAELREDFVVSMGGFVTFADVRLAHNQRCDALGREPLKDRSLSEKVMSAFPLARPDRSRVGGKKQRGWWDIVRKSAGPVSDPKPRQETLDPPPGTAPDPPIPPPEPKMARNPARPLSRGETDGSGPGGPGLSTRQEKGSETQFYGGVYNPAHPARGGVSKLPDSEVVDRARFALRNLLGKLGDTISFEPDAVRQEMERGYPRGVCDAALGSLYGDGSIVIVEGRHYYRPKAKGGLSDDGPPEPVGSGQDPKGPDTGPS